MIENVVVNIESQHQEAEWRGLYMVGAAAAFIAALVFRRFCSAELFLFGNLGVIDAPAVSPASAQEWFALLQTQPLIGLILLDVLDIVNYALVGLIYLALAGSLRRVNIGAVIVAAAAGLVGVAVYLASNQAFAMFALSRQYETAATESQKDLFLAAGEALLVMNHPGAPYLGASFIIALFLVTVAGLIFAILMLRSPAFGRAAAITGILAHSFMLGFFVVLAFAPAWAALPPSVSAVFLLVWYLLIGWRLFKLAAGKAINPST
jgi:hypothetical protein